MRCFGKHVLPLHVGTCHLLLCCLVTDGLSIEFLCDRALGVMLS